MRRVVSVVALGGVALSAWLLWSVVRHAGDRVYDLPAFAVAMGVVGALAAAAGWVVIARRGDGILLASAFLGFSFLGGVLALLSVGILLLVVGGIVALLVNRAAGLRTADGRPVPVGLALITTALVAVGTVTASLVASQSPVVECRAGGVSTHSSIFRGSGGGSSGSGSADGTFEGESTSGGRTYRYRCVGDELVEFEASDS